MARIRTAACMAVGSELLGDQRLDRNSLTITKVLAEYGVSVVEKRVVGDDVHGVAAALKDLLRRVDLVVVTGGLGPTADDVTRDAVAEAVGLELFHDAEVEAWIRERYSAAGLPMPAICSKMAMCLPGALVLRNTRGSAPGLLLSTGGALLAVFPGVPFEMEEMLERDLRPRLAKANPDHIRLTRTLLLGGVIESSTEQRIAGLYDRFGRQNVTILAAYGVLRLVLAAEGERSEAVGRLGIMEHAFRAALGENVAGTDVAGLAEVVIGLLRTSRATLATAESCTGGLIGSWITDVAGASEVYMGGVVSYSNEAKEKMLGVPETTLVEHGAVSEPVALAMARGARERFATDWALGITGIAGPGGGTDEKPVGLVHWAVAGPRGEWTEHRGFSGNRSIVRQWSANAVLDLLRRRVSGAAGED